MNSYQNTLSPEVTVCTPPHTHTRITAFPEAGAVLAQLLEAEVTGVTEERGQGHQLRGGFLHPRCFDLRM